jgi:hypothetical protein
MGLWATARYDLRLSDEEFWALTPRQFDALVRRHRRHVESQELLFGQLTSWVANTGFRTTAEPTTPTDFMPSRWAKSTHPAPTPPVSTQDRFAAATDALRMCFAGNPWQTESA